MLAAIGFVIVVAGTGAACVAPRTSCVAPLEMVAGLLVMGGLAMIGGQIGIHLPRP